MRKRSFRPLAALLAALVLWGALPQALAAEAPVLRYTAPDRGATTLTLENVPEDVYAVQLELTLEGTWESPALQTGDAARVPVLRASARGGRTNLTVYLVDGDKPLSRGGSMTLGVLTLAPAEQALQMPASATVSMLGEKLALLPGADHCTVQVLEKRPASGGSGGGPAVVPEPETPGEAMDFPDVAESDWCYSAARYVYEKGMMRGVADGRFAPEQTTDRGMIVSILHRLEGRPQAGAAGFADVASNMYYAAPVAWAVEAGIVSGYPDGRFGPQDAIRREQLAFLLYRYAAYKGYDVSGGKALDGFPDAGAANPYAVRALEWAVGAGLISGSGDGRLAPQGVATRAQAAAILMRFCEKCVPPESEE